MIQELDRLIPGEISGDSFYDALCHFSARSDVKQILEIGSSSGTGSTQAFVETIRARPDNSSVSLYCVEVSKDRLQKLKDTYAADAFVKAYNVSSVATDEFPSSAEIIGFFIKHSSRIRTKRPLARFLFPEVNMPVITKYLRWRRRDIDYIRSSGKDANGIAYIKHQNDLDAFDFVLIDGSEFTGEAELRHIIGSRFIALDDIFTYKCFNAYRQLSFDSRYRLIEQNFELRNGYAIFERVI